MAVVSLCGLALLVGASSPGCIEQRDDPVSSLSQAAWQHGPACPWGTVPTQSQVDEMCYRYEIGQVYSKHHFELLCPNFAPCEQSTWYVTGPKTSAYNCYRYADNFKTDLFLSLFDEHPDCTCAGCKDKKEELSDADCYYQNNGWTIASTPTRKCNFRMTCVLGHAIRDRNGLGHSKISHGYIEECKTTGWWGWGGKHGKSYRLHHDRWTPISTEYGGVVRCYERYELGANPDVCAPGYDPTTDPLNTPPSCLCAAGSKLAKLNSFICQTYPPSPTVTADIADGTLGSKCISDNTGCVGVVTLACTPWWCNFRRVRAYRPPQLPPPPFDLKAEALGYQADDEFGYAVVPIADQSGDGRDDVAIGVPGVNGATGQVVVVDGASGAALYTLSGAAPGDRFGHALAANQGYLAVGAPSAGSGTVYIYQGPNQTAVIPVGDPDVAQFGRVLASGPAGMEPIFVVGAPGSSIGGMTNSGAAFVFLADGTELWRVDGMAPYQQLGHALAASLGGWLIGAPMATVGSFTNAGRIWLVDWSGQVVWEATGTQADQYFGAALAGGIDLGWTSERDFLAGSPGMELVSVYDELGEEVAWIPDAHPWMNMRFGESVATPGDVDGDGSQDIVVSAPQSPLPQSYIYYGPFGGGSLAPASASSSSSTASVSSVTTGKSGKTQKTRSGSSHSSLRVSDCRKTRCTKLVAP